MGRLSLAAPGLLLILLCGCGPDGRRATGESGRARATDMPAPAAVTPDPAGGETVSLEAMCLEHGVLEAVCTRCNPRLIPVFKTRGDWCAEHDYPESFCPRCHPERGGRPAADVSTDEAPADGTRIRFRTLETARQAGIETVRAVDGRDEEAVVATARITGDPAHMARVNVPVAGVLRSVTVGVGARVARGDPLATLESATLGADRSRLEAARSRVRTAEAAFQREQGLHDKGISSARELQAARQELETARAEVAAGEAALGMVGTDSGTSGGYTLRAPISGVVTRQDAPVGSLVEAGHVVFEIIDTARLWAEIDVPETEAGAVSIGRKVLLEIEGLPGRTFEGTIGYLAPVVDAGTRTVLARAALDNRDGTLRANAYARARIRGGSSRPSVLVPRAAVHEAGGVRLVFVRLAEDEFITRRVHVGSTEGDLVALLDGVAAGEAVATTGSFLLKTETLKESIGAGCCDVEPPK